MFGGGLSGGGATRECPDIHALQGLQVSTALICGILVSTLTHGQPLTGYTTNSDN